MNKELLDAAWHTLFHLVDAFEEPRLGAPTPPEEYRLATIADAKTTMAQLEAALDEK